MEARLRDLHSWLGGSVEHGPMALGELLLGERLRVRPDMSKGFRVEGILHLALEGRTAQVREDAGRFVSVVAGGALTGTSRAP